MQWIGLKTLVRRECSVIARFWVVTIAPPAIATTQYFTIFGEVIGPRIGLVDGIHYSQYMTPGMIVWWVTSHSFSHSAAGFLGARLFRFIEEVLVSPLADWVIMTAYVFGGMIRGLLVGTVIALIAWFFTDLNIRSVPLSLSALFLIALVSALGGFVTALLARSFEQITTVQTLILTPLTLIGGVFAPLSALPDLAQKLSLANPMFYMVNAFRYAFTGLTDVPAARAVSIVTAFGVVLLVIALSLMSRGSGIRDLLWLGDGN